MKALPKELQPKGSWWARLIGQWRAAKANKEALKADAAERERFKYLCSLPHVTEWVDKGYSSTSYYILSRNQNGERRYEWCPANKHLLKDKDKGTYVYAHVVKPWVLGYWSDDQVLEWLRRNQEATR